MVISDFILDEVLTTVLGRGGHHMAVSAGTFLVSSAVVDFVWLEKDVKLKAWEFFKRHDDKGYSFTDCTSFVLMREMRISRYLSFDVHFNQAGFASFS